MCTFYVREAACAFVTKGKMAYNRLSQTPPQVWYWGKGMLLNGELWFDFNFLC